MRMRRVVPFFLLPFVLTAVLLVSGKPADFVIDRADESKFLGMTESTTLAGLLSDVGIRVNVQYANELHHSELSSVPAGLKNLLDKVQTRVILQHANQNKIFATSYPRELVDDDVPPVAGNPVFSQRGQASVLITWQTNEYAAAAVELGSEPGRYTRTFKNDLFEKQHEIAVTGLVPAVPYYFRTMSKDRSGNVTVSKEHTLQVSENINLYLPLVKRN